MSDEMMKEQAVEHVHYMVVKTYSSIYVSTGHRMVTRQNHK